MRREKNDISLHFLQQGDGFPLILLHGNGENSTYFEYQMVEFARFFKVIAIDTRGHGKSPRGNAPFTLSQFADDLCHFMKRHQIEKAHLLGFSDGGNIALTFVLRYPQMVDKLILNGANLDSKGVKRLVQLPVEFGYACASRFAQKSEKAAQKAELLALMVNEPHIDVSELHRIQNATLVIVGKRDMIKRKHSLAIYENLPIAEWAEIRGNHFIAHNNPKVFNKKVLQFLLNK